MLRYDRTFTNCCGEILAQPAAKRFDVFFRHAEQDLILGPAACGQQARAHQVRIVDEHARTEREVAHPATRLARHHRPDCELLPPDDDAIADAQIELRQQFGPNDGAAVLYERVRVASTAFEHDLAVDGESWADGAQLHRFRHRPGGIRRPHHRGRFHRIDTLGDGSLAKAAAQHIGYGGRPWPIARQQEIRRQQRSGLGGQYRANALDDGSQRDNRGDTNRHAHEKEEQTPPCGASLARRHREHESHAGRGHRCQSAAFGRHHRLRPRAVALDDAAV